jgi:hypothetical protein
MKEKAAHALTLLINDYVRDNNISRYEANLLKNIITYMEKSTELLNATGENV